MIESENMKHSDAKSTLACSLTVPENEKSCCIAVANARDNLFSSNPLPPERSRARAAEITAAAVILKKRLCRGLLKGFVAAEIGDCIMVAQF